MELIFTGTALRYMVHWL